MLEWVATEIMKYFLSIIFKGKGDQPYPQLNLIKVILKSRENYIFVCQCSVLLAWASF